MKKYQKQFRIVKMAQVLDAWSLSKKIDAQLVINTLKPGIQA